MFYFFKKIFFWLVILLMVITPYSHAETSKPTLNMISTCMENVLKRKFAKSSQIMKPESYIFIPIQNPEVLTNMSECIEVAKKRLEKNQINQSSEPSKTTDIKNRKPILESGKNEMHCIYNIDGVPISCQSQDYHPKYTIEQDFDLRNRRHYAPYQDEHHFQGFFNEQPKNLRSHPTDSLNTPLDSFKIPPNPVKRCPDPVIKSGDVIDIINPCAD